MAILQALVCPILLIPADPVMNIHDVFNGTLTPLLKDSFADAYSLSLIELICK